jgi:hypothetical protein
VLGVALDAYPHDPAFSHPAVPPADRRAVGRAYLLAAADRDECGMLSPDVLLFVVCTIRVAIERNLLHSRIITSPTN